MSHSKTDKFFAFLDKIFVSKPASWSFVPAPRTLLIGSLFLLISISLLMIASASAPFAIKNGLNPMNYFYNQLMFVGLGVAVAYAAYKVPMRLYCSFGFVAVAFFAVVLMLMATLVFPPINGAKRWIPLGVVNFQVAELCKLVMVLVAADYAVRRSVDVRSSLVGGGARLLIPFTIVAVLLMFQPDFGSFAVIALTLSVLVFAAGAPTKHVCALLALAAVLFVVFVGSSSYRMARVISFLDPFADVQDGGYQVANSLVALARGGITGVGYGDSIQKLSYLPEAHTDFLLAITGEELGMIGTLLVLALEFLVIASLMAISYATLKRRQLRMSYAVFGFAVIIFGQTVINAGMNIGMTPAKGLTLPFFSYGGSSMLVLMMMVGYALQADKISPEVAAKRQNAQY